MKKRPEFRDVLNHITVRCAGALERMANKTKGIDEQSEVGSIAAKSNNSAEAKREMEYQVKQGDRAVADQLGDIFVNSGLLTDKERGEFMSRFRKGHDYESINENLLDIVVRDVAELTKGKEDIDEEEFLKVLAQHQDHIARAIEIQLKAQHGVSVIHDVSLDTAPYDPATDDLKQRREEEDDTPDMPKA